jgi:A/G-specific adenine glycosylase
VVLQVNGSVQSNNQLKEFSKSLITWHKNNGRHDLPWQININPYSVWISEVMLQQTQVKTVLPYYKKFLIKYPNIKVLSESCLEDILESWAGLGFYRRAENIYKSSQIIKEKYECIFPKEYEDIISLPGIGRSTAGAILSIAYNKKYPILDGNVKRVIKRYFAVRGKSNAEKNLWDISEGLLPSKNNNIFTQAIMDLGSMVCIKSNPLCTQCPIYSNCKSFELNLTSIIPEKNAPVKRKKMKLYFLLIQNFKNKNLILMKKNLKTGIWENLWNLPSFNSVKSYEKFIKENKIPLHISQYEKIKHNLSHIEMDISILRVNLSQDFHFASYTWKNIYDSIACPKPVIMVITKLTKELD